MKKIIFLCLLFSFGTTHSSLFAQELNWVILPQGESNGTCTSNTDPVQSIACLGLEYTPGVTGVMTSYTVGYIVECNEGLNSINSSSSCTMVDNSSIIDACSSEGAVLLTTSGNSGSVNVTLGEPIIIHHVCFNLSFGDSFNVFADDITGATVSIDLPGGGATTDEPSVPFMLEVNDEVYGVVPCAETTGCTRSLGNEDSSTSFVLNGNGNLLDAASDTSTLRVFDFDFYDETNEICEIPGGQDDVQFTFELISTKDQYGGGIIDSLSGVNHKLFQDNGGLTLEVPFGVDTDSETSTGDVRGLSMKVLFANHIEVIADRLTVDLESLNQADEVFQSAALVFLDAEGMPFDILTYNGYFENGSNLTGSCSSTVLNDNPWTTQNSGIGTFIMDNQSSVNLTDPCNPVPGTSAMSTINVNARTDAGLDSAAVVQGYILYLYGEDVASPSSLDDGSMSGGEDNISGNATTSTNSILSTSILGYSIDGCVFKQQVLPVRYLSFDTRIIDSKVYLDWVTQDELNHSHFKVEWSSNGKTFMEIGNVDTPVKEDINYQYTFLHKTPALGKNYYRLKQFDFDGSHEYSKIKNVIVKNGVDPTVTLYPNPTADILYINLNRIVSYPLNVNLLDLNGNVLINKSIERGNSVYSLDLDNVPFGTFILMVNNKAYRIVKI